MIEEKPLPRSFKIPANLKVLYGFKTTGEIVRQRYEFERWYEIDVHVIPRDFQTITRYQESYEMHRLYPCEYVFDHAIPNTAFEITKFIRVFDDPTMVKVFWNNGKPKVKIGGEDFSES